MDRPAVVAPPYVAAPLRLAPFRGLMLPGSRVGDPTLHRVFARPYRAVAKRLGRWERQGTLVHDERPALYVHEYTTNGLTVRGLVGVVDVAHRAPAGERHALLPHEGVHPAQVDELADRMAEMQVNPAPILLVHHGPAEVRALVRRTVARDPDLEYDDRGEQTHRIWTLDDPDDHALVAAALEGSQALIADGHHRYAAYLRLQERFPGTAWDAGLAMLVDQDDTPLFLGAIHRTLAGTTLDDVERATLGVPGVRFRRTTDDLAVAALGPTTIALVDGATGATLTLDDVGDLLPVEVLHQQLVPALRLPVGAVAYHHTVRDAFAPLRPQHRDRVAVLLPAPPFDRINERVLGHQLLPQKATSFQPKPHVGAFMRSLRD